MLPLLSGLTVLSPPEPPAPLRLSIPSFSKFVSELVLYMNIDSVKLTKKRVFAGTTLASRNPRRYKPNARPPRLRTK